MTVPGPGELIRELCGLRAQSWREHAACKNMGSELFVIAPSGRALTKEELRRIRAAKAICSTCAVRDPCLAFALRMGERYGVWGGEYLSERRTAALRRQACGLGGARAS